MIYNINWSFTNDGRRNGLRTVAPAGNPILGLVWHYNYIRRRWLQGLE